MNSAATRSPTPLLQWEKWRSLPLGETTYLILDARYEDVRYGGQSVSCAVLVAVGVDPQDKQSVLGVSVSRSVVGRPAPGDHAEDAPAEAPRAGPVRADVRRGGRGRRPSRTGRGRVRGDPVVSIARPQMTRLPARRLDPGGRPSSSRTEPGAPVAPGKPDAGEIRADDTARIETGPIQAKSYRTRQLVRDDPSDSPREGAGGDGPRGGLGVSPARRMQCDPPASTSPEDPVTWDSVGSRWPRYPSGAPHALHALWCKPYSPGRNRGGLCRRAAQRRGRPTPTIGPRDDRIGFRL